MRNGAKWSVTGKILSEKNDAMESTAGRFTLQRPETQNRRQRYQYCWFCRATPLSQPPLPILLNRLERITAAVYRNPLKNPSGLQVCTARQSGQWNRFTHKHVPNPSKYRAANPCPHNRTLPHRGHRLGVNHRNFFPLSNTAFTSTARCSIKISLSGRVTNGSGRQTYPPAVTLFLWDQFSLRNTYLHTKHRAKKVAPSVNLMCGATGVHNGNRALLKGLLYCTPCQTGMVHSYTLKNNKRYRYYVCLNAQQRGWASCPTKSLNADEIEAAVVDSIRGMVRDTEIKAATTTDGKDLKKALSVFGPVWDSLVADEQSRIMHLLIRRVSYDGREGRVTVTFHPPGVHGFNIGNVLREWERNHGRSGAQRAWELGN